MTERTGSEGAPHEPSVIRWRGSDAPVHHPCTVCGDAGPHRPVLDVPALLAPHAMLRLIRCKGCGSAFYDPPNICDFSDLGGQREEFWRFYVEAGGGVWETIWPLRAIPLPGPKSLLDVGCGFGFAVDFWQRLGFGSAEGVELAEYGRVGARMLGITVHQELLERCQALADRRFDVVYASEVIEHVSDPRAFVALLGQYVAPDGMLVMTTPCASFVACENSSPTLLAALAPGFHGFLLSTEAFGDAARRAGFRFVEVRTFNERMVLWASRVQLPANPEPEAARSAYFEYMAKRFAMTDDATPVWQGYAYRYLRDLVNTGQWPTAKEVATRLISSVQRSYGEGIVDPDQVVPKLARATSLDEAGRAGPYFLPAFYYFLGCVAHHVDHDPHRAESLYSGAAAAIVGCARIGALFYLEAISLLWPARRAAAQMQLARGETAKAVRALAEMADTGSDATAANGYLRADDAFVETTLSTVIGALQARGQRDHAQVLVDALQRYIKRVPRTTNVAAANGETGTPGCVSVMSQQPLYSFETTFKLEPPRR